MPSPYEILGGAGEVGLFVRLKSAQSGVANAALKLLPGLSHEEAAKKMQEGLRKEGVDAEVTVVSAAPPGIHPKKDFVAGIIIGVAGAGLLAFGGWKLWTLVLRKWIIK